MEFVDSNLSFSEGILNQRCPLGHVQDISGRQLMNDTFGGRSGNVLWPSCMFSAKETPLLQAGTRKPKGGGNQCSFYPWH